MSKRKESILKRDYSISRPVEQTIFKAYCVNGSIYPKDEKLILYVSAFDVISQTDKSLLLDNEYRLHFEWVDQLTQGNNKVRNTFVHASKKVYFLDFQNVIPNILKIKMGLIQFYDEYEFQMNDKNQSFITNAYEVLKKGFNEVYVENSLIDIFDIKLLNEKYHQEY